MEDFRISETLRFYDTLAEWYDLLYLAQGVKQGAYHPETVAAFHSLFLKLQVKRILDCACGTGDPILGLCQLEDRPYRIAGSDGSDEMLAICRENAHHEGIAISESIHSANTRSLPILKCTWSDLPSTFGADSFDLVMCRGHGLYHLITRDAIVNALKAMAEITSPGGWVLFDTVRWQLDTDGRACGEERRDLVKWRGWIDLTSTPALALPAGASGYQKLLFLDVINFRPDARAVGGVVQDKTVFVFGEKENELKQLARLSQPGAAFSYEKGKSLLEEAGLEDVQEFKSEDYPVLSRWTTLYGRKR